MYIYRFQLTLSKRGTALSFDDLRAVLPQAIDTINAGLTFRRDGKAFTAERIEPGKMTLLLRSRKALTNPARSISALTRYLTTFHSDLVAESVYNKTLFSIVLLDRERVEETLEDPAAMTSEDLLKAIVDLLYGYSAASAADAAARKEAIQTIKALVAPFRKP